MNLRQKAKHYKRRYEALANTKIQPTIIYEQPLHEYKVDKTLRFPTGMYNLPAAEEQAMLRRRLASLVLSDLTNIVESKMEVHEISSSYEDVKEVKATFICWVK